MPITKNNAGLNIIPLDTPEPWEFALNANWSSLAGVAAIVGLGTQPATYDPATLLANSLTVNIYSGFYAKADGTIGSYAGATAWAVAASSTVYLWLTDAGVLTTGAAWPTTAHVRLAIVTTDATHITGITDARVVASTQGTGLGFALKTGDTFTGTLIVGAGNTLQVNPTAGTVGFFGAAPATQAATTAALTDNSTGVAGAAIADAGAAYTQATLNNNFASLTAKVNALIAAIKRHGLMAP